MAYKFLISDITQINSQKSIGTDKGLAKIGDGIVNLAYSVAKSIYLTKKNSNRVLRTGLKVSKKILNVIKSAYLSKSSSIEEREQFSYLLKHSNSMNEE